MAKEDIITQHQAHGIIADKILGNKEGLGQAFRAGLLSILKLHAQIAAITQKFTETGQILGGGNNQNLADASQHQHRERIVDKRFVVDR